MCFGVLKSGSPTEKFITSIPFYLMSAAFVAICKVKDGLIFDTLFAMLINRVAFDDTPLN